MLRLIRTVEKVIELVANKLNKFDLDLDKDIFASTTDGTSALVKFGIGTSPIHIHLQTFTSSRNIHLPEIYIIKKYRSFKKYASSSDMENHIAIFHKIPRKIQRQSLQIGNNSMFVIKKEDVVIKIDE